MITPCVNFTNLWQMHWQTLFGASDAIQGLISSTFCMQIFCLKVLRAAFFYIHVTREKLPKRLSYKKFACKMLMKLTPV